MNTKLTERHLFEQGIKPENTIIPLDAHTIEFPYMHFDQDVIVRYYNPIRFDKRYRNPSLIAQEDFIPLYNLYHINNFKKQYGNKDKPDYYLIIDEKEEKFEQFILGGIMITADESEYIINFINDYKRRIIPNLNPKNWFVKGSNTHERRFKKNIFEFNKRDNINRWMIFGEMLEYLRVNYTFHFSIIDNIKKKIQVQKTRKAKTRIRNEAKKEAFKNLLLSIDMFKYNNLHIITDNIDSGTESIYIEVIKEFCPSSEINLKIVKKQEMHTAVGSLLQYVDINLYAIFRLIFPSMHKGKFNILADFELFSYKDFKKIFTSKMTKSDIEDIEKISKVFESIKNVYHNIKLHSLEKIYVKNKLKSDNVAPLSSIIYKDIMCSNNEQNNNFAHNFIIGVDTFCSIRTNETFSISDKPINFTNNFNELA